MTTRRERFTVSDWYDICVKFTAAKAENPSLSRNAFLRSSASGTKFQDTRTVRNAFVRNLRKFKNGELKQPSSASSTALRLRHRKYQAIEEKLVEYYIQKKNQQSFNPFEEDDDEQLVLSYAEIKQHCLTWARELGFTDFKCSNKWIANCVNRYEEVVTNQRVKPNENQNVGHRHGNQQLQQQNVNPGVQVAPRNVARAAIPDPDEPGVVSLERALAGLQDVQNYCKKIKHKDASSLLRIVKNFLTEEDKR